MSRLKVLRFVAVAGAMAATLTGCPGPPTACSSVLQFDTQTWCAGGPWVDAGATRETLVGGAADTHPPGAVAQLQFGASDLVGASTKGGIGFTFTEQDPDGTAEGFGPGTFDTSSGELSIAIVDSYNAFVVSRGSITITRLAVSDVPLSNALTQLSATFEVDTDHGHLTGVVRIN
ncbi:MAG: hypothetical protein U0Q22_19060 [Acidimicrobiales bacterium]